LNRCSRLPILVSALAVLACAAPARAQGPPRVRDELARTDMRIARVEMLFARNPVPEARPLIDRTKLIQARAWSAFDARRPEVALGHTLHARGDAERAASVMQGLPDPDRVQGQLERTREIIERARERIAGCELERPRFLLQVAGAMEQRAEAAAADGRHLAALQLSMSARERAVRALRLCHLEENARDSAERALRRTDQILARARDAVGARGDERARQLLGRAVDSQAQARREFAAERYDPCLRLTQSARTYAYRAIRSAGGTT